MRARRTRGSGTPARNTQVDVRDGEGRVRRPRTGDGRERVRLAPEMRLFINFSPAVIYEPDVCLGATFRACAEVGADPSRLVFEVTEAHAFPDLKLLRRILDRYRAEGAHVALDDIGSGHTSLLYLSALRPDYVKLDRGLLSGITNDDPRAALVGALIRYAHDLDVRVIAEGIETREELQIVHSLGADLGQGYFLARPAFEPAPLSIDARAYFQPTSSPSQ